MNEHAKVSIIMPAHNAVEFIGESVGSVLSQDYRNWELIIINDRSTDDTYDLAMEFAAKDARIIVLDNESELGGAYFARNLGLHEATGTYISFLDSDDSWLPNKLSAQIDAMNSSGCFASHCDYTRVDREGRTINVVRVKDYVTYQDQLKTNRIPNLTGIYDRNRIGVFLQKDFGHEDYEMWLRILRKTASIGVQEPLAKYRVLADSLSSNKLRAAFWHYNILKKQADVGFAKRVYYFLNYVYHALAKRV